jgi:N-acyl-D-aspartate/D-glutamate deacylase
MPIFSKEIKSHPRAIGTFSRVLAEYVRGNKILSLSEALAKMSYLPAKRLEGIAPRFKRKGRIQPGADADIVIFDVASIRDRATYDQPYSPSTGITAVIVNGKLVVNQGIIVPGVFPGRIVIGG